MNMKMFFLIILNQLFDRKRLNQLSLSHTPTLMTMLRFSCFQNGRDDCLLTNALMTPPRSSTFLDTGLHKDVFGVISGTCEWGNINCYKKPFRETKYSVLKKKTFVLFCFFFLVFCTFPSVTAHLVHPQHQLRASR